MVNDSQPVFVLESIRKDKALQAGDRGKAIAQLAEESGEYQPRTDGTLRGLIASMDAAGIGASVVANMGTSIIQPGPPARTRASSEVLATPAIGGGLVVAWVLEQIFRPGK